MIYIFIVVFVSLTILMCWQESRKRKINFLVAILICLIATPLVGYFVLNGRPLRNPRGCDWCDNDKNEAEYCSICGKNIDGKLRNGY